MLGCILCWTLGLGLLAATPAVAQGDGGVPVVVRDLLDQGDAHRAAGRFDRAAESYREAIEKAPEVVEAHVGLGAVLGQSGDLEGALAAFETGLEVAPEERSLLFNSAVVARRLEEWERALGHAERGVAAHPEDLQLRLLQANLLDRLDRFDEAVNALESAEGLTSRRSPEKAQVLYRLGNALYRAQRPDEAVGAYRAALALDDSLLRAQYNLGSVLFELDRLPEALEAYSVALAPIDQAFRRGEEVDPSHATAYANLGAIHAQAGNDAASAEAYGKARRLDPERADVLYNLGFAHYRSGHLAAAREAYEAALERDEDLPVAYLHLGEIYLGDGGTAAQAERAAKYYESAAARLAGSQRMTALRGLGESYAALGRSGDAETVYRELLESSQDDPSLLLAVARITREDGRLDEARALLERARRSDPGDVEVGLELAGVLGEAADEAAQKALYESLLQTLPADAPRLWRVRLALALLELGDGRADAAEIHLVELAKAENVDAESSRVISALRGVLAAEAGDLDTARELLRRAEGSDAVPAREALALVDALDGRAAEAVDALASLTGPATRETQTDANGAVAAALHLDRGLLLWSLGRHDEARPHLRAALPRFGDDPVLGAALGDLALRDGDLWQAIEHLGRAAGACGLPSPGGRPDARALAADAAADAGRADAGRADAGHVFQVRLAAAGAEAAVCDWVDRALGAARVTAAVDTLSGALAGRLDRRTTRSLVEAALTAPLGPPTRAAALFVRGTLRLHEGDVAGATQDLSGALDSALGGSVAGGLPPNLVPHARNNLGVAYARQGRLEEARAQLDLARRAAPTSTEATLNLALFLDHAADDGRGALELYREYLERRRSGPRADEVARRVERLREIYR